MGIETRLDFGAPRRMAFAYGERAADLARRVIAASAERNIRALALKGVAIADELYGGFDERPVADADVWILDPGRFADAVSIARGFGLRPFDRSDHVLALREEPTGVILELHARLTSAATCFDMPLERAWTERVEVGDRGYCRLGSLDALIHMAEHAVFQHALAVRPYHLEDFRRGLSRWTVDPADLLSRARSMKAARCVGALAVAAGVGGSLAGPCPESLRRAWPLWAGAGDEPPSLLRLFRARFASVDRDRVAALLGRTIVPEALPGHGRESSMVRAARLVRRAVFS